MEACFPTHTFWAPRLHHQDTVCRNSAWGGACKCDALHQQIPAVGFEVETALNLKTWWLVSLAVSLILGWERYLQGPAIATWPKPGGLGCQAIQLGFEVEDSMNEVERLNGRSGFVRARSQGSLAMVRCNEMCILSSVTVYHTGQIY